MPNDFVYISDGSWGSVSNFDCFGPKGSDNGIQIQTAHV